jgi:ATP-dependent RNA helicase DDX10/DBP4
MNKTKVNKKEQAYNEIEDIETRLKHDLQLVKNETEEKSLIKTSNHFKDLPLSNKTKRGLKEHRFNVMTPIQKATIYYSLSGKDILGASKTGSGKTLCFVIPVLELLYRNRWSSLDGLGALLILPTRELAIQVFEVFKQIGKYHDFSIGLVIGGNNLENEKNNLYKMNILIGTPGRITQHISETPYFNTDNLKLFVIDEADRILDEGFENEITEIVGYLPESRQTLLFSATLTKSLKRVAKMNLKEPEYINLNNTDQVLSKENMGTEPMGKTNITPLNLDQYYTTIETHQKIDTLFSFLQTHKNSKCIVFVSSCKQVRFYCEIFKKLKLAMTFLDLHGRQKQSKRTNIFYTFASKKNTVLFATDIASRGVDFKDVDWVIQFDCPDDISSYIHRVGRTARYKSKGNSLMFLNKQEENFVKELQERGINIKGIKINQIKMTQLRPILRSLLSEKHELLYLAQRAISTYVKSVYLMSNKNVFDIGSINIEELALSYGLMSTPELKIQTKSQNDLKNQRKDNFNGLAEEDDESSDNDEEGEDEEHQEVVKDNNTNETNNKQSEQSNKKKSKLQKLKEKIKLKKDAKALERANLTVDSHVAEKIREEETDQFLTKKRAVDADPDKLAKPSKKQKAQDVAEGDAEFEMNDFYDRMASRLKVTEDQDKLNEKKRVIQKHYKDKLKRKEKDYEKHGLLDSDGEDNDEGENEEENNFEEPEEEDLRDHKVKKSEQKINTKTATLEEKETAALKLLQKTNKLFG